MEAFPRILPLFASDLCPAKGGPHITLFTTPIFENTMFYSTSQTQKYFKTQGKAFFTCSPFPFLSVEWDPSGTQADPLRQWLTPFAWANLASPTTSKDSGENKMRLQKQQHHIRGWTRTIQQYNFAFLANAPNTVHCHFPFGLSISRTHPSTPKKKEGSNTDSSLLPIFFQFLFMSPSKSWVLPYILWALFYFVHCQGNRLKIKRKKTVVLL